MKKMKNYQQWFDKFFCIFLLMFSNKNMAVPLAVRASKNSSKCWWNFSEIFNFDWKLSKFWCNLYCHIRHCLWIDRTISLVTPVYGQPVFNTHPIIDLFLITGNLGMRFQRKCIQVRPWLHRMRRKGITQVQNWCELKYVI